MVLGLSFIVFCMLTLWVAWKASTNITSLRDYVLSHQRFGQLSLFATIVASFVGGGVVMGTAQKTFQFGIGHGLGLLGFGLQLILTGWWIAPRMGRFRKLISLGDLIARYYGKVPQILTGVFWLSFCVGILAAQMSAMGNLMTNLLGFDRTLCILVSAAVVVIYCYWGGIKAVVSTDHLQFVLLSIALFLVTIVGIYQLGGWQSLVNHVPTTHWSLTSHLTGWELTMIFFSFLLGDALIPPVFQRLLMGKSQTAVRNAYVYSGLFFIPICVLAMSHGFIALAANPSLSADNITPFLFQEMLPSSIAIIALMGFIAVIMSSADSYLNAAAGSLVSDIINPLRKNPLSENQSLKMAKMTTLLLGFVSLFFAIAVQDILDILLKTYEFWGPTLVVPILGIIANKRVPLFGFYASVLTGGLIVFTWNTFHLESSMNISALVAGLLGNAMVYFSIYFCTQACCPQNSKSSDPTSVLL